MGQSTRHTPLSRPVGADFDGLPLVDAETRATWVVMGEADSTALEIYWHAADAARRGESEADCPYTGTAAGQWVWMFRVARAGIMDHRTRDLEEGRLPL